MKRMVVFFALMVACLMPFTMVTGCARHMGPHMTSTAYPPETTAAPAAMAPVVYNRTVKEQDGCAQLEAVCAAYASQGNPKVGVAYFSHSDTMDIRPQEVSVQPYDTLKMSVENTEVQDGKEDAVRIDVNKSDVVLLGTDGSWDDEQLISWSEVQQEVFDVLLACNFHITDPEISTLTEIDFLLDSKKKGVSQHTAELAQLRNRGNVDVLVLISETDVASKSGLNGRIWDLRTGRLIGAHYVYLVLPEDSCAGRILARRKARELVTEMLQQTAHAWTK